MMSNEISNFATINNTHEKAYTSGFNEPNAQLSVRAIVGIVITVCSA
jgi:hypothetical protein